MALFLEEIMDLKEYQVYTRSTRPVKSIDQEMAYLGLGLAGEAGEVANEMKRAFEQGREVSTGKVIDELGDVLWYLARFLDEYNMTFEDLAAANKNKLVARSLAAKPKTGV